MGCTQYRLLIFFIRIRRTRAQTAAVCRRSILQRNST